MEEKKILDFLMIKNEMYLKIDSINTLIDLLQTTISIAEDVDENSKLGMITGLEYFHEELEKKTEKMMVEFTIKKMDLDLEFPNFPSSADLN